MFFVAIATATFFFLSIIVWNTIVRRRVEGDKVTIFKRRLRDYARMKQSIVSPDDNQLLHAKEHEILLRILKKVEAKNGVMATIWSLLFTGLVTATFAGAFVEKSDAEAFAITSSLFLLMSTPFLITSIWGTRQIDNYSCYAWLALENEEQSREKLQILLIDDALMKEEVLWFSQIGAALYALILPILAFLFLWCA